MNAKTITSAPLFEVFAFLQLLDFMTTMTGLKLGGQEINPFLHHIMGNIGVVEGLLVCKFAILVAAIVVMRYRRERVIVACNYLFAGLAVWNLTQLLKLSA